MGVVLNATDLRNNLQRVRRGQRGGAEQKGNLSFFVLTHLVVLAVLFVKLNVSILKSVTLRLCLSCGYCVGPACEPTRQDCAVAAWSFLYESLSAVCTK